MAEAPDLGRMVPHDAPHQGVVIEVEPLEDIWLADLLADAPERATLLVLDQVTDPHNVGAILRSAAAFGAIGIVTQDRHAPPEGGALAKAASGALERVPWVRVVNLARALGGNRRSRILADRPRRRSEDGAEGCAWARQRIALVLGAEGPGMRHNVREHTRCAGQAADHRRRSKASTSPTRPRSPFMRRVSPDGPHDRNPFHASLDALASAKRHSPRCSIPTASPSRGSASRASRRCCAPSSASRSASLPRGRRRASRPSAASAGRRRATAASSARPRRGRRRGATRSSTASIVNAAGSSVSFTSSQRSGVETGAPGCGRTE